MGYPSARELVMTYGWNTTAYQILNPGLQHWFPLDRTAVVAYSRRQNVMLVAGAPVCATDALLSVMRAFEDFARRQECRVCYVCAADRMHDLVADSSEHSAIVVGAQPVWNPQGWAKLIESGPSMRGQLARARNKGVTVELIGREPLLRSSPVYVEIFQHTRPRKQSPSCTGMANHIASNTSGWA